MNKIIELRGEDYILYLEWVKGNPSIPAGKTTVDAFLDFKDGQTRLEKYD